MPRRRRSTRPTRERTADEREAVETFDAALAELEQLQTDDFEGIFRAMDGLPVVIRLIDPPLHEFLPTHEELLVEVTRLRHARADRRRLDRRRCRAGAAGPDQALRHEGRGARDAQDRPREPEPGRRSGDDRSALEAELAEKDELLHAVEAMREQNPMLGLRGCRLGLIFPDINEMQVRAILRRRARGRRRA